MLLYSPFEDKILLDITPRDDSYCQKSISDDNIIVLHYSLAEHVELPIGTWCEFGGEVYTLEFPAGLRMEHSRFFDYTLTMYAPQKRLERFILRNTDKWDGRTSFFLTAPPIEHLKLITAVMNINGETCRWVADENLCLKASEKTINYDNMNCYDALRQIATTFETEWEVFSRYNMKRKKWERIIVLHKVEYNGDTPLSLSYGRRRGIKGGVTRNNFEEKLPLGRLYVQSSERNIDPSKYNKYDTLRLPSVKFGIVCFDGDKFDGEDGFDVKKSKKYRINIKSNTVELVDMPRHYSEQTLDCTEFYPSRVGRVSKVDTIYEKGSNTKIKGYDILDASIPESLDFAKYEMKATETMYIVFQDGNLAGREFDIEAYEHAERRFKLVSQEIDGVYMPNIENGFMPKVGDSYAVFGIDLYADNNPVAMAYFSDNETRTGASWDMLRKALRHFCDKTVAQFSFKGELDRLWVRDNRELAATKIRVGGIIAFSDERFQPEPVLIRIVSTKQNINVLDDISIEMSDERWKKTPRYVTFDKEGRLTLTPVKKTASYQQQTAATRQNKRLKSDLGKAKREIAKLDGDILELKDKIR